MAKPSAVIADKVKALRRFIVVLPVYDFIVAVDGSNIAACEW
jgi:hypothetical protein